ncbi:ATP synthase subunit I [Vallitaleaceae bacterium 9-2]
MNERKSMVYELTRNVLIIIAIALFIGLLIVENRISYALGLGLGAVVSILKIHLMEHSFRKAMYKAPHAATNYVRAHYFLRYFITFLVLFIGVYTSSIHFIGLVIGVLALKPAAYIQGLFEPEVPKDGSVEFLEWEDEDEDEKSDFW